MFMRLEQSSIGGVDYAELNCRSIGRQYNPIDNKVGLHH